MSKWFFVFGNWDASSSEGVNLSPVLTHYRLPVRWDRFDNLPEPLIRQVEGAKTVSRDRRSVEYLLSPQVLFHHGFIPTLPSSGGSALAETPRKRGLSREPYNSRSQEFMALANARRARMALPSSVESPASEAMSPIVSSTTFVDVPITAVPAVDISSDIFHAGPNAAGSEDFISTGSFSHLQGFLENAARIVPREEPMDIQKWSPAKQYKEAVDQLIQVAFTAHNLQDRFVHILDYAQDLTNDLEKMRQDGTEKDRVIQREVEARLNVEKELAFVKAELESKLDSEKYLVAQIELERRKSSELLALMEREREVVKDDKYFDNLVVHEFTEGFEDCYNDIKANISDLDLFWLNEGFAPPIETTSTTLPGSPSAYEQGEGSRVEGVD